MRNARLETKAIQMSTSEDTSVQSISIYMPFIYHSYVSDTNFTRCSAFLKGTQTTRCPTNELGLRPNGHQCSGWVRTSCSMFHDNGCYAPLDTGVCCPSTAFSWGYDLLVFIYLCTYLHYVIRGKLDNFRQVTLAGFGRSPGDPLADKKPLKAETPKIIAKLQLCIMEIANIWHHLAYYMSVTQPCKITA